MASATDTTLEEQISKLATAINDLRETIDDDLSENKRKKEEDRTKSKTSKMKIGLNLFSDILEFTFKSLDKLNNSWGKVDQAAFDYAKSVGMSQEVTGKLRSSVVDLVKQQEIGLKYNTSAVELLQMQTKLTEESGRNLLRNNEQWEKMAAMRQLLGENVTAKYIVNFEKMGFDVDAASKKSAQIWNGANKSGISAAKYSKNLLDNFDMVQRYTFKNGIEGLQEMARQSTAIRWDMQQTASFAEKVSTIEGAVKTGASLSVLGGGFANVGNPMQLLYGALNDVESLNERVTKMFSNMATYNEKTKQIEVSAFNRMRIKSATQAMGIDFGKTMDSVYAQGRRKKAESELSSVASKDKDLKDMILNMSQIDRESGKSYVTIVGENKDGKTTQYKRNISELSPEDLENLRKMSGSESEDIKKISAATQGTNEKVEGIKKHQEAIVNNFLEKTIGPYVSSSLVSFGSILAYLGVIQTVLMESLSIHGRIQSYKNPNNPSSFSSSIQRGSGEMRLRKGFKESVGKDGKAYYFKDGKRVSAKSALKPKGMSTMAKQIGTGIGLAAGGYALSTGGDYLKSNGNEVLGMTSSVLGSAASGAAMLSFLGGWGLALGALGGAAFGGYREWMDYKERRKKLEEGNSIYKFATGGIINGQSHAHGGVNIEAEGGEFIVNKASTSKHIDELKAINNDTVKADTIIKSISPMGEQLKVDSGINNNEYIGTNKINFSPMDIGMNGTLKLDLGGYTKDIDSRELMQNQDFIRSVRDVIAMEMNKIEFRRFNKKEYYRKM